jgi:DNA-binding MarR family transcriptional regulator
MGLEREVRAVQTYYPMIYLACHVRHQRASSTASRLSARDSSLLAHLDEHRPMSPAALAKHLSVRASTLSAGIARLARLGYLVATRDDRDRRRVELRLSAAGARAMSESSVLDAARLAKVLDQLTPRKRAEAIRGLGILAEACSRTL